MRFLGQRHPKKETILLRSVRGTEDYLTIRHANPVTGLVTPSPQVMTPIEGFARTPRSPAEAIQLYSPVTSIEGYGQGNLLTSDTQDQTRSFLMVIKRAARALSSSAGSRATPIRVQTAAVVASQQQGDLADGQIIEAEVFPCRPVLRRNQPVLRASKNQSCLQNPNEQGDSGRVTEILEPNDNCESSKAMNAPRPKNSGIRKSRLPSPIVEVNEETPGAEKNPESKESDTRSSNALPIPPVPPHVYGNLGRKPSKYTLDQVAAYWNWVRQTRDVDGSDQGPKMSRNTVESSPGIKAAKSARRVSGSRKAAPSQLQVMKRQNSSINTTNDPDDVSSAGGIKTGEASKADTDELQCMNVPQVFKEERWMRSGDWLHLPQVVLVHPSQASQPRSPAGSDVQRASSETLKPALSPGSIPEPIRVLGLVGEGLVVLAGRIPFSGIDERMMATFRALANPEAPPRMRLQGLKNACIVIGQALIVIYAIMCFIRVLTLLMEGLKTVFLPLRLVIKVLGWVFKV